MKKVFYHRYKDDLKYGDNLKYEDNPKSTKPNMPNQTYQTKNTKSDKYKLALSLAQLSSSLFFDKTACFYLLLAFNDW